ncbi:hypothetical protein [Coleofasciculus sp. E2-BRE-01]
MGLDGSTWESAIASLELSPHPNSDNLLPMSHICQQAVFGWVELTMPMAL